MPLIRWHVESMPNHDTIKQKFFEYTHKKDNTQQQDFVWGAREQQHYFTYPKKKSTPLFHYIGVKLIFLGLAAWFISSVIHNLSTKLGQPQMQAIQAAAKQMLPTSSAVVLSTDVQQPTPVRNNKLQQPMEDEQSINESKIQEAALKENIWNRDFINKGECLASDSIVDCGNKHIRNRNNFEQFWNAKKTKFSTQP